MYLDTWNVVAGSTSDTGGLGGLGISLGDASDILQLVSRKQNEVKKKPRPSQEYIIEKFSKPMGIKPKRNRIISMDEDIQVGLADTSNEIFDISMDDFDFDDSLKDSSSIEKVDNETIDATEQALENNASDEELSVESYELYNSLFKSSIEEEKPLVGNTSESYHDPLDELDEYEEDDDDYSDPLDDLDWGDEDDDYSEDDDYIKEEKTNVPLVNNKPTIQEVKPEVTPEVKPEVTYPAIENKPQIIQNNTDPLDELDEYEDEDDYDPLDDLDEDDYEEDDYEEEYDSLDGIDEEYDPLDGIDEEYDPLDVIDEEYDPLDVIDEDDYEEDEQEITPPIQSDIKQSTVQQEIVHPVQSVQQEINYDKPYVKENKQDKETEFNSSDFSERERELQKRLAEARRKAEEERLRLLEAEVLKAEAELNKLNNLKEAKANDNQKTKIDKPSKKQDDLDRLIGVQNKKHLKVNKNKEKISDVGSASRQPSKIDMYTAMKDEELYQAVRKFLRSKEIQRKPVNIKELNEEFGAANIKKLITRSYLISTGKGVTIGR